MRVAGAEGSERTLRPGALGQAVARGRDRRRHELFREATRGEIGLDAEAARTACAERPRPLVRERDVTDPTELAAAGDGRGRGLAAVAEGDEARGELFLGVSPAAEYPGRDVERRRREPDGRVRGKTLRVFPRPARTGRP